MLLYYSTVGIRRIHWCAVWVRDKILRIRMTRELRDEYFFLRIFLFCGEVLATSGGFSQSPGAAGFVCFVSKIQRVREKVKPH